MDGRGKYSQLTSKKALLSDILSLFTLRLPAAKAGERVPSSSWSLRSLNNFQAAFRGEAASLQLRLGNPFLYEILSPVLDLFENVISKRVFRHHVVTDEDSPIAAFYPRLCQLQHLIRIQLEQNRKLVDLYQYIHFSKHDDKRQELLADIEDFNDQLETQSGVEIETFSTNEGVGARIVPHFIRDRLVLLHKELNRHFSCKCGRSHGLSLRLSTHQHLQYNHKEEACLEVSFSSEVTGLSKWQEAKISIKHHTRGARSVGFAADSSSSPKRQSADKIAAICQMISDSLQFRSPFHLLLIEGEFQRQPPYPPVYDYSQTPLNLNLRAAFGRHRQAQNGEVLTPKGRLILAVILANGLLPFLGTPWLARRWDYESIIFFYQPNDPKRPNVTRPFLVADADWLEKAEMQKNKLQQMPEYAHLFHPIPELLSLGILLCELEIGRPIETLLNQEDLVEGRPSMNANYLAATKVLDMMGNTVVERYRKAIKACLKWTCIPPQMDPYKADFDSPDMRQSIYENVVKPLEEELFTAFNLKVDALEGLAYPEWAQCWGPPDPFELTKPAKSCPRKWQEQSVSGNHSQGHHQAQGHLQQSNDVQTRDESAARDCASDEGSDPQDFMLFDIRSNKIQSNYSKSEAWLDDLSRCYQKHLTKLNPHAQRVKIAIIDTGYDGKDSVIHDEEHRIRKAISKVENGNAAVDFVGHGTHALALLLKVAPFADVYVIQLANSKILSKEDWILVEKAIEDAVDEWDVDIISMSFGLRGPVDGVRAAVAKAHGKGKIMFAAASNNGGNSGRACPADDPSVICVHSTDGEGNKSGFSPSPHEDALNFSILGEEVESSWPPGVDGYSETVRQMSGTSVATPIAAGIAATVLAFARNFQGDDGGSPRHKRLMKHLKSPRGMTAILKLMVEKKRDGYDYITPWWLFKFFRESERIYENICERLEEIFGVER